VTACVRLESTVVAALVVVAGIRVAAQQPPADAGLADLDRRLQEATVKGDLKLLDRHLAEDFVHTHSGGDRDSRADWLARAKQVPCRFLARDVSEQVVEVHGNVALVLGRLDLRERASAEIEQSAPQCWALRYVHLFAKREGRWMFLSHWTTQVMEARHPCP
jgi:ketosteroid isomerase-like protein